MLCVHIQISRIHTCTYISEYQDEGKVSHLYSQLHWEGFGQQNGNSKTVEKEHTFNNKVDISKKTNALCVQDCQHTHMLTECEWTNGHV